MTRIVATDAQPSEDTGLRFTALDDGATWLCPSCGSPFAPEGLEE
jgi:rubredoxin